ncbi:unnamed protein product [Aphanomyces euteiches]
MRQVPVGVVGEIYLGGICVSPGYINLPEQTAERFMDDPFVPRGGRMFRTGDYGRLLPNGHFEIHGRKDSQVKLKGYHIELEEIGEAMMRHPQVTAAAAVVKDKTHLVGYFTPASVDVEELRTLVASHLPVYMVPAVWIPLESMPQNVNGKTDRLALEAMDVVVEADALETEAELKIAAVWSQVLGVNAAEIGANSSFFALGGDSISAIRLVAKAKQFGFHLTTALALKYSTLKSMATRAHTKFSHGYDQDIHGTVPLTPIQCTNFEHPWKNVQYWNLSLTLKSRLSLRKPDLQQAISKLVDHHDMLRARYSYNEQDGWSQYVLHKTKCGQANVNFVNIQDIDDLEEEIMTVEQSFNLISGPVYAVTIFVTSKNEQYLQFTAHHAIVDLVSWRILIDDLESLLRGKELSPKSLSFKEWSELLSAKSLEWDGSDWNEYMCDDVERPLASSNSISHSSWLLNEVTTAKLDSANEMYGTNIQELVLASLTRSLAELRGNRSAEPALAIMLDSHGREPWNSDIDISSTVGWFTNSFPVVFYAIEDVGQLLIEVKRKLRNVPHKGLSYGAIKYLNPESEATRAIKTHRPHNIDFLYSGRFQELNSEGSLFEPVPNIRIPQNASDELPLSPGLIIVSHEDGCLKLSAAMEEWLFTQADLEKWIILSEKWLHRIVDHCLKSST